MFSDLAETPLAARCSEATLEKTAGQTSEPKNETATATPAEAPSNPADSESAGAGESRRLAVGESEGEEVGVDVAGRLGEGMGESDKDGETDADCVMETHKVRFGLLVVKGGQATHDAAPPLIAT